MLSHRVNQSFAWSPFTMPNTIILVHVVRRLSRCSMQHSSTQSSSQSYDADLFSFTFPDLWRFKAKSFNILIQFIVSNIYSYLVANKKDDRIENRRRFAHMKTTVSKPSSLGSSKINEVWILMDLYTFGHLSSFLHFQLLKQAEDSYSYSSKTNDQVVLGTPAAVTQCYTVLFLYLSQ